MPALHRSLPKFITYRHETAESEVNRRERRSCAALFTAEARREIRRRARHGRDARNGLAHIDHQTGRVSTWRPGVADQCGEPVFVPRSAMADEGDGFLLSVIWRAETNSSDLAVFDAGQISAGPVALAHLSHRVPSGFHGNWRGSVA
jgi:carotenoid cleavage dioxygenase-like enzyme